MDRLLNEDILIGTGWSARETLRTLAYSTLADVTHHVKQQLSLAQVYIYRERSVMLDLISNGKTAFPVKAISNSPIIESPVLFDVSLCVYCFPN